MIFKRLLLFILFVALQGCSETDDTQYLYMPPPPKEQAEEQKSPVVENADVAAAALPLKASETRVVAPAPKPVITPVVIAEDAPVKSAAKVIEPAKITPPPTAKKVVVKSPEPQKTVVSVAPPAKVVVKKEPVVAKPVSSEPVKVAKVVEEKKAAPAPQVVVKKEPVVKKPVSPEPVKVAKVIEAKKITPPMAVKVAEPPPVVTKVKVAAMPLELTHAKDNPMASHDSVYTFFEDNRFQKLDGAGKPLPDSADEWACVKDKANGEVWEAKTDGKNRNKLHTYVATGIGGQCGAESCLADNYAKRVNASALCGFTTWRVPNRGELLKLVYFEHPEDEPTADIRYFINTRKGRYITSTDFKYGVGRIITVDFESGYDKSHKGDDPAYLRLVVR